MSQLQTYFLGPFRVKRNDKSITGFESDKMRALLAYLVLEADHAHRREELAALLWPDQAETAARQSLRQALYILQKALSEDREDEQHAESSSGATAPLLVTRQTVQLNPAGDISSDVRLFTDLQGSQAPSIGVCRSPPLRSMHRTLEECDRAVQGRLLAGLRGQRQPRVRRVDAAGEGDAPSPDDAGP